MRADNCSFVSGYNYSK